jgi:hypothetical protein
MNFFQYQMMMLGQVESHKTQAIECHNRALLNKSINMNCIKQINLNKSVLHACQMVLQRPPQSKYTQLYMEDVMKRIFETFILVIAALFIAFSGTASAQEAGMLSVGAARVNITPPSDAAFQMSGYSGRGEGFTSIHDSLYYRVIVLDDGQTQAAIVIGDVLFIRDPWWEELSSRIEEEAGIQSGNLLLAATHTHGAPTSLYNVDEPDERLRAYTKEVADKIVRAVQSAKASLQPARMGVGRGRANININRTARTYNGQWRIGLNPDGVSDKTVHVVRFEDLNGEPIALLANYAVHGTIGGGGNYAITGDVPGATASFAERHYGDDVVVAWTSGAAGDQNPLYQGQDDLDDSRIRPLTVLGQILGEEVIRVSESIDWMTDRANIRGAQKVVTVPGKERGEYETEYTYVEADSLDIRLSVLMINNVALVGVSGEVLTGIGMRLKEESPYAETIMITHTNGSSGYLVTDEAYKTPGYEVVSTRARSGAEDAIVNGLLDLIHKL